MRKPVVLVADDDSTYCKLTQAVIAKAGYQSFIANDLDTCRQILNKEKIDILFQDLAFPSIKDGFEALDYAHEEHPETAVIMVSGEGHIPDALRAVRSGAIDYLPKPVEPEMIIAKIKTCENLICLEEQNKTLSIKTIGMIGNSPAMQKVYESIIKAAKFDTPVLIHGETGVGKELVANAIHNLSRYSNKNMVCVNCGAIPDDLVASELFGHLPGAFTGADKEKKGFFELAEDNTIFLNEIGELPFHVQANLLRILSEGEAQKLGGKIFKVKCRVICDTNINIPEHIEKKLFRQDLYYRISTIDIEIPRLRDRKEDIPDLANYFMNKYCIENNFIPKPFTTQAMAWLIQQPWKGNVRELRNIVERSVINAINDHITVSDLHSQEKPDKEDEDSGEKDLLKRAVLEFKKSFIINALQQNDWNVTQTAQALHTDKSNLTKWMKEHQIIRPDRV